MMVVVELFLTVFLGLVVEEVTVEQAKGLELELSDQDLQVSADWPQAALSQRSQLY
jgi:hypothetical protein